MSKSIKQNKQGWLKKRIVPLLTLILTIAITIGLFYFSNRYPGKVEALGAYGYIGFFIVSLISSASVILPVPGVLILFPLVATLNPLLVALAGSTGGIIGEITAYMAGYGGRGVTDSGRLQERTERWMKRWGTWTVFAFATIPLLPFDIAGLVAGALHYPFWKFMIVGWVGKSLKFIALAYAAAWGWQAVSQYFGW